MPCFNSSLPQTDGKIKWHTVKVIYRLITGCCRVIILMECFKSNAAVLKITFWFTVPVSGFSLLFVWYP